MSLRPIQITMEEVTDPQEIAEFQARRAQAEHNSAWLQAHAHEIYTRYRGRFIVVAGEELFVGDTPAEAHNLAKAAHGSADDLLSTLYLAFAAPVLLAPAMNTAMWEKAAVQRNVTQIRADGVHFVDPSSGWLSCRQVGAGRMAEPEVILAAIEKLLGK